MLKLEDIKKDAQIRGLEGDKIVRIVHAEAIGTEAVNVFYVDQAGKPGTQSLFRTASTANSVKASIRSILAT